MICDWYNSTCKNKKKEKNRKEEFDFIQKNKDISIIKFYVIFLTIYFY